MKKKGKEIEQGIEKILQIMDELDDNTNKAKETVKAETKSLHQQIDEREATLIAQIQQARNEKRMELDQQLKELREWLNGIQRTHEFTNEMTTHGTPVEVFLSKSLVLKRYDQLIKIKTQIIPPIQNNMMRFDGQFNRSKLIESIKSYGKIEAALIPKIQASPIHSMIENVITNANINGLISKDQVFKILVRDDENKPINDLASSPNVLDQFIISIIGPSINPQVVIY